MSYDNLSSVSQNVLKFYQQLTGEERRIPSRVIGLDMTENRNMAAVQNLKGEILQLILSRKGGGACTL
jgi:hypothetical protein